MPSLGADMEAGTLVEWLVKPGAPVKRGDVIAVVETQKGAIEIEVFEDGVFEKELVEVGSEVPVGTAIADIAAHGEEATAVETPAVAPAGKKPEKPAETAAEPTPVAKQPKPSPPVPEPAAPRPTAAPIPPQEAAGEGRAKVTPAARKLAAERGVGLSSLRGSGPQGEIVLADVERATGTPAKPAAAPAPASGMRAAIAAAMARSKREIPHYYLAHSVDLTAAETWLAARNAKRGPADRLLMGALYVKAVARAALKYPEFNGHFEEGVFRSSRQVHAGVAINIRGTGLVAPAIHDADQLDLDTLMATLRDLVDRVRAGRFRSSEIADPTITVSSLGDRGVETLYGVIYPPQVAIVGFGVPVARPWVVDGMMGPRRIVSMTLAGDHRVSDGHRGALFLNAIANLLAEPEAL
jgi:pyruvate dehydrogenase E2 component (dihydrolipoamide acetyltransferase)